MRKKYEKADFKVVSLDFCDIVTASIGDGDNRRDDDIFGGDGGRNKRIQQIQQNHKFTLSKIF